MSPATDMFGHVPDKMYLHDRQHTEQTVTLTASYAMLWALRSAHLVRIPYIHSSEHWPTHSPRSEALLTQVLPLNLIESLLEITYIDFEPAYGHAAVGWAVAEPEWGGPVDTKPLLRLLL